MGTLRRVAQEPIIEHVSSFVIRCSFCDNHVRKDVLRSQARSEQRTPNDEYNTKIAVQEIAKKEGWKFGLSTHDTIMNVCPQHVYGAMEMGVIPDTRPKSMDDPDD